MIFKKIYVILIMGLTLVFLINSNKKLNLELYDESVITSHNTINVNEVDYEVRYSSSYFLSNGTGIVFDDDEEDGTTYFSLKDLLFEY